MELTHTQLFDQCAVMAAAHGSITISAVERQFRCGYALAAQIVDELAAAGVVGDYVNMERHFIAGNAGTVKKEIDACFEILKTKREPARGWWMALDMDRRAAVMRAAVVPWCHARAAWDALPESARGKLRGQHDKRRRNWVLLNAEFSGRVEA
jgi:hypothetical protein